MAGAAAPRGYILDTNVISNPGDLGSASVAGWIDRHAGMIRLSVVSVAEMHRGLYLLQRKVAATADRKVAAREQQRLDRKLAWYRTVLDLFGDRIEPIDVPVAQKWAEVSVRFPALRDGDKAIAATALAKGYGVATENLGDFRAAGVPLVNPFDPGTWGPGDDGDPIARLRGD
ncbi:MAG TPA: PIN domain-containing protein [Azospirillaceae bacterium]|nr:PIN domain-containing protein [Azospirillaceae bacterium]